MKGAVMTAKGWDRTVAHQAGRGTSQHPRNSNGTITRVKAVIVMLAQRGSYTLELAHPINRIGGPHDE
jgi:hypothetical protein